MDRQPQTILQCTVRGCNHVSGDINQDPRAWDGWQCAPIKMAVCPSCIDERLKRPIPVIQTNTYRGKVIHTLANVP